MAGSLSIVILAAGQGRRMHSDLPKVLHQLAGKPLLQHVINTATQLPHRAMYIVCGHGADELQARFPSPELHWVQQPQQLGTGHAVAQAMDAIPDTDQVLVLYGDIPLTTHRTLERLTEAAQQTGIAIMTGELPDASGYGRIVRDAAGTVQAIVEEKDADDAQRAITEINSGILTVEAKRLQPWLQALNNSNAGKEYYLTDIIAMAVAEGIAVPAISPDHWQEIQGVNDRQQLAELERYYQFGLAQYLMWNGVTLLDPTRFDCRGELQIGRDVSIDINAVFEGKVSIGNHVRIGPNCRISNASLGDHVIVKDNTVIEDARIGEHCSIGPFARIRPETELADHVAVGNFVEIKKSQVQSGSKINHLAYVGDSEVGKDVNIGAGAITCNYDGANKYKTVIGNDVFIGSNSQLVAPVTIGDHATIAAGTTVTKDVQASSLEANKRERKVVKNWQRPKKK
ncbi:MAG: bifunctional UDP-N-acetylglucosamine diphosphorylase/glucosamine-1-phosphate N-acetyltransferase GlmU [Gammaproteobacteria bacterium]